MNSLTVQFIPLAIAAITPTIISATIMILSSERGLQNAFVLIFGRAVGILLLSFLVYRYGFELPIGSEMRGGSETAAILQILFGGIFVLAGTFVLFKKDREDKPQPRWMTRIQKLNPVLALVIGFFLAFFLPRITPLVLLGVSYIVEAGLPLSQAYAAFLILTLAMVWPQLVPLGIYVSFREKADSVLQSLNGWIIDHQRLVNVAVLGLIGIRMLWNGLIVLL